MWRAPHAPFIADGLRAFAPDCGEVRAETAHALLWPAPARLWRSGAAVPALAVGHDGDLESVLKDTVLMMIDEQNKKGGLLGKKLEPVVVDPASNWPLFAEKARQLLTQDKVAVIFGCWTSVPQVGAAGVRGAQRPALSTRCSTRARSCPRTSSTPAPRPTSRRFRGGVPDEQGRRRRQALGAAGTDYVYPRTTNKILRAFLQSKGVEGQDIVEVYTLRSQRLPDHRRRHQRSFRPAARRRWSRPSTATPTCRSTRSSATPA